MTLKEGVVEMVICDLDHPRCLLQSLCPDYLTPSVGVENPGHQSQRHLISLSDSSSTLLNSNALACSAV